MELLDPITEFDWQDKIDNNTDYSESKIGKRFENMAEEHLTIFLSDPFNNILEFKYYFDTRMVY